MPRPTKSGQADYSPRKQQTVQKPTGAKAVHSPSKTVYDFRCPVASRCGGCQMSGKPYKDQLAWKQKKVETLLGSFCTVDPILGMQSPYHYRNKVHAVLSVDKRGLPVSGVYAQGTHHVVPVRSCLLEDLRADKIIRDITALLPKYKLRIYNEYTHRGFLRHIVIRTGHISHQIMVILVATAREFPGGKAFTQELLALHPEITTLVLNVNQR